MGRARNDNESSLECPLGSKQDSWQYGTEMIVEMDPVPGFR